jgi:hypothetical protein
LQTYTDVSEVLSAFIIDLMMEAERACENWEILYQTTRRYNPEDGHFYCRRRENLNLTSLGYCALCFRLMFEWEKAKT